MLRRFFGKSKPNDKQNKSSQDDVEDIVKTTEKDPPSKSLDITGTSDEAADDLQKNSDQHGDADNQDVTVKLPIQRSHEGMDQNEFVPTNTSSQDQDGKLAAAGETSVGKQRDHNEDSYFLVTYSPKDNHEHFNFGLYIVADGMGGHLNGEVASLATVNSVSNDVINQIFDPMVAGRRFNDKAELHELLQNATQNAQLSIREQAPGGGTTMTTLLVTDNLMTIAHIGDSRAYLIGLDGSSEVLTRDHSFVKKLIELGHITEAEAAVHPQRNVLYRALGQGESYEADIITTPLPSTGHLLICSDGLWGVIPENEIVQIINSTSSLKDKCDRLIDAANKAGGPDNITAIVVRLPD